MKLQIKTILLLSLSLLLIGAAIGYYFMPTKTVEVETIQEKERIKTVTVVKEVTRPDGSKEKETTIVEDTKKSKDTDKSKVIPVAPKIWAVTALVGKDTAWNTTIGAVGSRRLVGDLFVGLYAIPMGTKAQGGIAITYEF